GGRESGGQEGAGKEGGGQEDGHESDGQEGGEEGGEESRGAEAERALRSCPEPAGVRPQRVGAWCACSLPGSRRVVLLLRRCGRGGSRKRATGSPPRSEEHTSELQSRENLVC